MPIPAFAADSFAGRTERRDCPRISVSYNALVRWSDTLTFRCFVRNLSRDAAQIVCDVRYALLVQPIIAQRHHARRRGLEVSIALPLAGGVSAFTTMCVAKYCAPFEGDHMVLGLKFVDLDRASRERLGDFIAGHQAGALR